MTPTSSSLFTEKIQATIKIQAAIRGYQVRKKLKTEEEAATKIQAQFRGHLVRNSQRGPRSDADADDNKAEVPELSNLKYEGGQLNKETTLYTYVSLLKMKQQLVACMLNDTSYTIFYYLVIPYWTSLHSLMMQK